MDYNILPSAPHSSPKRENELLSVGFHDSIRSNITIPFGRILKMEKVWNASLSPQIDSEKRGFLGYGSSSFRRSAA